MVKRSGWVPVVAAALAVAGCQTTGGGGTVSLEEAKQISAKFAATEVIPPKRTVADFLERYGAMANKCYSPNVGSLRDRREKVREQYELRQPLTNWWASNRVQYARNNALEAFVRGNVENAIVFMGWAEDGMFQSSLSSWTGWSSIYAHLKAIYRAYAGDIDGAKSELGKGDSLAQSNWRTRHYSYWARSVGHRAAAAVDRMEGDIAGAMANYVQAASLGEIAVEQSRKSKESYAFYVTRRFLTSQLMTQAEMTETLIRNGKPVEAEGRLRAALSPENTSGTRMMSRVYAMSILAKAVFAQGRYRDAYELSKLVAGLYEADCSGASLAAAAIRATEAKALLALNEPKAALEVFRELKTRFEGDARLLASKFDDNVDWAVSELLAGDVGVARARLERALEVTRARLGENSKKERILSGALGLVELKEGNAGRARRLLRDSARGLLNEHGGADGWVRMLIFEGYLDLLMKSGTVADAGEAFEIGQGLQSSSVQRALSQNAARAGANNPELAKLIRDQQDLERKIEALRATLAVALSSSEGKSTADAIQKSLPKLSAARDALVKDIAARFPRYDALVNPKPLSVADVRRAMKAGQSALVIRTLREKTFVWAVPKSGDIAFQAVAMGSEEMADTVARLRGAVDPGAIETLGDIPAFDVAGAYGLYARLLKPVEKGWKSTDTINLVAQGPIGQLPLSMLPTAPSQEQPSDLLFAEYRGVEWLAKSHAVAMLPSVGSLIAFSGAATVAGRRPFIGFGDPYFSGEQVPKAGAQAEPTEVAQAGTTRGAPVRLRNRPRTRSVDSAELGLLPRLPETADELRAIAAKLGADPAKSVFLGEQANEKTVKELKLDNVSVLAFATHGLVSGDLNGLDQPALALSAPEVAGVKGDGLLTMGEILALKLNADWVVLSACNTAAADGAGAEAVSGLGRAFFYAGAKSLLVSNWPVHSDATALLTTTLFRLQTGDRALGRAQALKQTRLSLIAQGVQKDTDGTPLFTYAHPIFWAPFTVIGDGGGVVGRGDP